MTSLVRRETGFTALRQGNTPRKLSINPKDERLTTLISASTVMEGSFKLQEGLKIDGKVKGDVIFGLDDGLCIVSKGAIVEGNLCGPKALIMGEVQGNIEVENTLVVAPTAVIVGSVKCGKFIVYDGAAITGTIETIRQAAPAPQPMLEISTKAPEPETVVPLRRRFFGSKT